MRRRWAKSRWRTCAPLCRGWPGIHIPSVKDWIVNHQIPAAAWYVASPNLTVVDTRRLERIGTALDEFLNKTSA